jgi:predicted NACHT family NTPase
VCYRLLDLDEGTLRPFLASHLKKRAADLSRLTEELNEFLPHLPRMPLMLKLVATVFDENGTIPRQRVALFDEYTRVLFRPSVTNLNDASGFPYALRHLTRHTFLASGGDRELTVSQGVMLLRTIKDVLADFRINTLPVDLVGFFVHAGIYRRNGDNLRFFHDSYESYLGANALEAEFREQKFDMVRQCAGNLRLIEMWDFFLELLSSEPDKRRLEEALANFNSFTGRADDSVATN